MKTVIADLVDRLALPPEGVDLRAELVDLQSARVRQALEQSGGDLARAARLLRMSRLDLMRLEARIADGTGAPPAPDPIDPGNAARIAGGVEFISAAAIRRYAVEGLDERAIASRLGCNVFIVEKVLREQVEASVRRLDAEEQLPVAEIAAALRIPRARVRHILLQGADACAPSKRKPE
jgi:hypothetical protein